MRARPRAGRIRFDSHFLYFARQNLPAHRKPQPGVKTFFTIR
jgi:hypothetical protein